MKEREIKLWDSGYTAALTKETPEKQSLRVTPKIEPYYSITEAAKLLNIPRRWIDDAINGGELAYYQMGAKARKVKLSAISALIEKHQIKNVF